MQLAKLLNALTPKILQAHHHKVRKDCYNFTAFDTLLVHCNPRFVVGADVLHLLILLIRLSNYISHCAG